AVCTGDRPSKTAARCVSHSRAGLPALLRRCSQRDEPLVTGRGEAVETGERRKRADRDREPGDRAASVDLEVLGLVQRYTGGPRCGGQDGRIRLAEVAGVGEIVEGGEDTGQQLSGRLAPPEDELVRERRDEFGIGAEGVQCCVDVTVLSGGLPLRNLIVHISSSARHSPPMCSWSRRRPSVAARAGAGFQ